MKIKQLLKQSLVTLFLVLSGLLIAGNVSSVLGQFYEVTQRVVCVQKVFEPGEIINQDGFATINACNSYIQSFMDYFEENPEISNTDPNANTTCGGQAQYACLDGCDSGFRITDFGTCVAKASENRQFVLYRDCIEEGLSVDECQTVSFGGADFLNSDVAENIDQCVSANSTSDIDTCKAIYLSGVPGAENLPPAAAAQCASYFKQGLPKNGPLWNSDSCTQSLYEGIESEINQDTSTAEQILTQVTECEGQECRDYYRTVVAAAENSRGIENVDLSRVDACLESRLSLRTCGDGSLGGNITFREKCQEIGLTEAECNQASTLPVTQEEALNCFRQIKNVGAFTANVDGGGEIADFATVCPASQGNQRNPSELASFASELYSNQLGTRRVPAAQNEPTDTSASRQDEVARQVSPVYVAQVTIERVADAVTNSPANRFRTTFNDCSTRVDGSETVSNEDCARVIIANTDTGLTGAKIADCLRNPSVSPNCRDLDSLYDRGSGVTAEVALDTSSTSDVTSTSDDEEATEQTACNPTGDPLSDGAVDQACCGGGTIECSSGFCSASPGFEGVCVESPENTTISGAEYTTARSEEDTTSCSSVNGIVQDDSQNGFTLKCNFDGNESFGFHQTTGFIYGREAADVCQVLCQDIQANGEVTVDVEAAARERYLTARVVNAGRSSSTRSSSPSDQASCQDGAIPNRVACVTFSNGPCVEVEDQPGCFRRAQSDEVADVCIPIHQRERYRCSEVFAESCDINPLTGCYAPVSEIEKIEAENSAEIAEGREVVVTITSNLFDRLIVQPVQRVYRNISSSWTNFWGSLNGRLQGNDGTEVELPNGEVSFAQSGIGISNGELMNDGNFQVEGACGTNEISDRFEALGGVENDGTNWFCVSEDGTREQLREGDFLQICRETYGPLTYAVRVDDTSGGWRCVVGESQVSDEAQDSNQDSQPQEAEETNTNNTTTDNTQPNTQPNQITVNTTDFPPGQARTACIPGQYVSVSCSSGAISAAEPCVVRQNDTCYVPQAAVGLDSERPTTQPQDSDTLLNDGIGAGNGAVVNNGQFQVENYCESKGWGETDIRTDLSSFYCTDRDGAEYNLNQENYNEICSSTYNTSAYAEQTGSEPEPAYRWRCFQAAE